MTRQAEKRSARDLCVCGHWRNEHLIASHNCTHEDKDARLCPCEFFRCTVNASELAKGAKHR